MNPVLLDGRSLSDADLRSVAARPDIVRLRIHGLARSVAPLSALAPLRELDLTDPRTLDGLEQLQQLESLTLYAFPRITSLNPLGTLTHLKKLLLSTPPGYDASRKCYDVESLEPIGRLIDLEALTMRGIAPRDGRLDPIQRLVRLRRVDITHVDMFTLEDYARLAISLPNAEGHCLRPVFEATWAGVCAKCGRQRVVLTAPPPRSPRMVCPICQRARLDRHIAAWHQVTSAIQ